MDTKKKKKAGEKRLLGQILYALFGLLASRICVMGYYPFVPAFYAACCLDKKKNLLLYIGLFAGMGLSMPVASVVKYLFSLLVLGIAIRFYVWANRRCSGWTAGVIAGITTIAMNCSGLIVTQVEKRELILGISEGIAVFGLAVLFHYVFEMGTQLADSLGQSGNEKEEAFSDSGRFDAQGRIHAFADAVDELSAAFASMGKRSYRGQPESLAVLEQEITGKLCGGCDACAICMEQQKPDFYARIRQMLTAVVSHSPKEEIISKNYIEDCPHYSGMVEEAIWAFSRMELNEAWYRRLQENRMVIAGQLDAMSSALLDMDQGIKNVDARSKLLLARINFEVREYGLVAEQLHIYEDRDGRRMITAQVASKWGGGIPAKNYRKALERATGIAIRLQKDARNILTQEAVSITAYEDTCFYALSGVASETKEGSGMSGDNFSLFTLENGHYHICLSDGMGSGPDAFRESDMVVELMEKFLEAGFPAETAIRMMNSAMVLKGENESYSTLDFASLDLYSGHLELTKIGAAASFVCHNHKVSCLTSPSLPAGVDASYSGDLLERNLTHGDFLVMVTDGVLEYLHVKNPEEKLAEMISEINTENAGTFASTLMEHVMLFTGGHAMDDMTIIVTGIWEK